MQQHGIGRNIFKLSLAVKAEPDNWVEIASAFILLFHFPDICCGDAVDGIDKRPLGVRVAYEYGRVLRIVPVPTCDLLVLVFVLPILDAAVYRELSLI